MKSRSNYRTQIRKVKDQPFIMIEDLGGTSMTVTNNIEKVLDEIAAVYKLNPIEHHIIYKDTDEKWDGFILSTKTFIPLREDHWLKAANKLIAQLF